MSQKSRERQKNMVEALKTLRENPVALASKLLHIIDEPENAIPVTATTPIRQVVTSLGDLMASKHLIRIDVVSWAKRLYGDAELAFEVDEVLIPVEEAHVFDSDGNVIPPERPAETAEIIPIEAALPAAKEKKNRRPYLGLLETCLENGGYKQKELAKRIVQSFPSLNEHTVYTFLSDLKNPKYTPFKDRAVVTTDEGLMTFADLIEQPAAEVEAAAANG